MNDIIQPKVYMVRAEYTRYAQAFLTGGYVGIGWLQKINLESIKDKEQLRELYEKNNPDSTKMSIAQNVGQIWRFLMELTSDTYVITPLEDNSQLAVGRVVGDYDYDSSSTDSPYSHRKKVEWYPQHLYRNVLSIQTQNTLRSSLTIFQIPKYEEILSQYISLEEKPKDSNFTDEGIKKAILERILDLSFTDFEILVQQILTAIGFDTDHVGQPGDDGIDVKGKLRIYGFATIDLKVQVKRYQPKRKIDHKEIQKFRGQIPENSQGSFVTTSDFTPKAREEAEKEAFKKVGLINGTQLVEILIEHYDGLGSELQEQLRLRKTLIPLIK